MATKEFTKLNRRLAKVFLKNFESHNTGWVKEGETLFFIKLEDKEDQKDFLSLLIKAKIDFMGLNFATLHTGLVDIYIKNNYINLVKFSEWHILISNFYREWNSIKFKSFKKFLK